MVLNENPSVAYRLNSLYHDDMNKNIVVKSNEIVEANYTLTLAEQRILLMCISCIDSRKKLSKGDDFVVSAEDYAKLYDVNLKNAYRDIKSAADKLYERSVYIFKKTSRSKNDYKKTRWISGIEYVESEGRIQLSFAPKILPYLSKLESCYTQYNIDEIAQMQSSHTVRVYEMMMQWKSRGWFDISLVDLKKRLNLGDDYPRIYDLKKRVIIHAVNEINKTSKYKLSWSQKKVGRNVSHFTFNFKLKNPSTSKKNLAPKPKILSDRIDEFVRKNPGKTKGKTREQVIRML